jgi:hypothetical protein
VPPFIGCPKKGTFYPEVTRSICRVPSTLFSQAPWYTLPVHQCRFGVRSKRQGYFLGKNLCKTKPLRSYNLFFPSTLVRCRNINLLPIDYDFRPRLRGRLTLRGLPLHRNPWTFGGSVFHTSLRYSCQHSHFRYLQKSSHFFFNDLRNAPLLHAFASGKNTLALSVYGFSPVTFSAQIDLIRLVSYYAFFKGWLLLSQPPSCLGQFTSFST